MNELSELKKKNKQMQDDLELLRDQVDVLQIQATEKKKPWYKESGLWISIFALIFSLLIGIHGWLKENSNEAQALKEEEMQDVLLLVNIESQLAKEANDKQKDVFDILDNSDEPYQDQFDIILHRIDDLDNKLVSKLTYADYSYIAYCESSYEMEAIKPVNYYNKALSVASNLSDSILAYKSIASLYTHSEFLRDSIKIKECLNYSLTAIEKAFDSTNRNYYFKEFSNLYAYFCDLYCSLNNRSKAIQYLDSSKIFVEKINKNSDFYSDAKESYNRRLKNLNCGILKDSIK